MTEAVLLMTILLTTGGISGLGPSGGIHRPASSLTNTPADSNGPTFTLQLSLYNATLGSSSAVNSALTGWLFINGTGMQEVENFTVTNGGHYTYQNFSSVDLTDIGSILVVGAEPSGYPNATAPLVQYSNLTQQSSVTVSLNFSNPDHVGPWSPPSPGTPPPVTPMVVLFVELAGVGLFLLVVFIGVIGGRKLLRPTTGGEDE